MDNEEVDLLSDELENLENEKKEQLRREEEERQAQEKAERMAAEKAAAEEQLRIEKERLAIEKKRASLAQSQTANAERKKTSSSCLSILLVIVTVLGGGAYYLFSDNGTAQENSLLENSTDNTTTREFIETLETYASEGIEAANEYKVKKMQLQPSATQYNYKGTITYERLGRDFTNAITVTYNPEKGSIKWNILETQEELDYVNNNQHSNDINTNNHEYADLNLPSGLLWAKCNLGADSPNANGSYFSWGETSSKSEYTESSYSGATTANYNVGTDAARAQWGGSWRIPTVAEWRELEAQCSWVWDGKGFIVTGTNGNSIYLPAAGYCKNASNYKAGERGDYWTSTPKGTDQSYEFVIKQNYHGIESDKRHYGASVRPVFQ